jgi:hypothetical protein
LTTENSEQLEVETSTHADLDTEAVKAVETVEVVELEVEPVALASEPKKGIWSRVWVLSEDWVATIVGLILVILLITRVFHAIP